jgi:integrase
MACSVTVNQHSILTFRIYFHGVERWKSTGKPDTPENRREVEALAVIISKGIREGTFSWDWNQDEGKSAKPDPTTIGGYYAEWILRKTPPVVRAGLERDYKDHFNRYILPKFRAVAVVDLSPRLLEDFRAYLLTERGLALKSVRNIVGASFRACIRDARKVDYLIDRDPFEALTWPRPQQNRPDPFTEVERDIILAQFAKRSPFYVPFVYTLFFTGARPSELLGLRWGDVDLRAGFISISKSRYLDQDGAPKTAGSDSSNPAAAFRGGRFKAD